MIKVSRDTRLTDILLSQNNTALLSKDFKNGVERKNETDEI